MVANSHQKIDSAPQEKSRSKKTYIFTYQHSRTITDGRCLEHFVLQDIFKPASVHPGVTPTPKNNPNRQGPK
eukprot:1672475-Amphidinium_carterae.1